jgi:predicted MPP superfamily phosphohydrolase
LVAIVSRVALGQSLPFLPTTLPLLILAGGLAAWGVRQATVVPEVRVVNVTLPGLPQAFEGYRIIQLSDIHASRLLTGQWVEKVVEKANARKADLIVLTGDMSDGYVSVRRGDVAPLGQLRAKDGIYAIAGNHEYYFNYDEWMPVWSQLGIPFLLNGHVRLYRDEHSIVIAGVTDEKDLANPPNVTKALAGTQPDDTVILLDHRPGNARENARHNVKLQLSGHTHGGMIRPLEFAIKPANNGFVSGRYQVAGMQLYVSNGTGLWNGFPLRIGRPSEITELVLHRQ